MKYDISKQKAPEMPNLGKGTECIKILLSQASKDMYEPLVPMLFPVLGARVCGAEFQYPDLTWKELCGQMAHLVAESGGNKGQLPLLVDAIHRDSRQRAGALRATADGVTGNPILRVNITFSSTPDAARSFYKKDLTNGFFGRIPFSYKARDEPGERLFLQLKERLPNLVHHQLPPGCKDFSDYYLSTK